MSELKYGLVATYEMLVGAVFLLPRHRTFNALKSLFLRAVGAKVGRRVVYYSGVWIMTGRGLVVGDDVDFARGVLVTTDGGVTIGDRVLIGYGSRILSSNHRIPPGKERIFGAGHVHAPVSIESDVWIGSGCMILPGVTIGEGAVVGAGSVVSKAIAPYVVAAGVPAKEIRRRCPSDGLEP